MNIERSGGTSIIDVLDRVLDKGIVVDAWIRISVAGIDLITIEAHVVVASVETRLKYAEELAAIASPSGNSLASPRSGSQLPRIA